VKLAVLAAKLAGFVGARLAGAAIGFISQFLLARLLSVADVGVVLMGMSAASFVSLGANGGYALLAMTQLPKIATHGRQRLIDAFNNSAAFDGAVRSSFSNHTLQQFCCNSRTSLSLGLRSRFYYSSTDVLGVSDLYFSDGL
jgi:hypothetical protein